MFSCTCIDFTIHSTICKHVHLVIISDIDTIESSTTTPIQEDHNTYFSKILQQPIDSEVSNIRKKLQNRMKEIDTISYSIHNSTGADPGIWKGWFVKKIQKKSHDSD